MTNPFPDYKVCPVADLVPYARNSRTHSAQQIDKIAASIKEFGFLNPVITDGANGIVAGHGRVLAAQKLGIEMLPVIEASHLTEAQRRAYVIADNRLALDAGWDDEMLKIELKDLDGDGFDLTLTGFELGEMAKLFDEPEVKDAKEADIPDNMQHQMILSFDDEQTLEEWFNKAEAAGVQCKIL